MRKHQLKKINGKKLIGLYSDFDLEDFVCEIAEHTTLLSSIGYNIKKAERISVNKIKSASTSDLNVGSKKRKYKKSLNIAI
jgi:hypothetical protein